MVVRVWAKVKGLEKIEKRKRKKKEKTPIHYILSYVNVFCKQNILFLVKLPSKFLFVALECWREFTGKGHTPSSTKIKRTLNRNTGWMEYWV